MSDAPPLEGILETVLYCDSSNEDELRRFYTETLGLELVAGFAFRFGGQLLLIFNADESRVQDDPPPHGTVGATHTCFTCEPARYEDWKTYLQDRGVEITREIEWPRGPRSFYFEDPAGNVLEIANGDMWPPGKAT